MVKKITSEDLVQVIERGFRESDKRTDEKIEKLAVMVQKGFDGVTERMDKMENGIGGIYDRLDRIENRLDLIESDLADIKNKLYNVIDRHEFEILKDRVVDLERRLAEAINKKK